MLEHAFRAERLLRKAATELQLGDDVFRVMKKVDEASKALWTAYDDGQAMWEAGLEEADVIRVALEVALDAAIEASSRRLIEENRVNDELVEDIRFLADKVKEVTGKRCTFFNWNGERKSLAAYLNDLASCIHHLALWMTERRNIRRGVCAYIDPRAPSWARELCLEIEDLSKGTWAEEEVLALATSDELQVRTGNPKGVREYGHAVDMYIRKTNSEFEVEWYPKYEEYDKIAEKMGLKRSDRGFKGKLSLEALKKLFKEIIGR